MAIATELADTGVDDILRAADFQIASYSPTERRLVAGVAANGAHNALYVRDFDTCQQQIDTSTPVSVLGRLV